MINRDNPILNNERYTTKENSYIPKHTENIDTDKSSSLSILLISLFNYIKSCFFSFIYDNEIIVQPESEQEPESGSDIEYIKTEYRYTNDYHIVRKHNLNRNNNSILQDSFEQSLIQHPLPPSRNTTSQLLQKFINQNNSNEVSHQYGTDLSIATPVQCKYKCITPTTYPLVQDQPKLDSPRDNFHTPYHESILNYYIPTKPMSLHQYSLIDNFISNFYIDKISSVYESTSINLQNIITKKRLQETQLIQPLTDDQLQKVNQVWQGPNKLVCENYMIDLYTNDLTTLKDGRWLNDNVIDYYLNLVMKNHPSVFAWTTHFYSSLASKGYQGVSKWAKRKKIDVFKKSKILVPVNISNTHWALSVVDNDQNTITYYDSLDTHHGNPQAVENLSVYMNSEANKLGYKPIDYELIPFYQSPQQKNGSDCGVFTCTAASFIASGKSLNYSQKDMKTIRRRMVWEILQDKLID